MRCGAVKPTPFDPMEKAIHDLYERTAMADRRTLFQTGA